ncbi:high-affinity nickel-transport protein-domain-containing protein [Lasiosphaeria miniovina]|uniref:Nickel/cobalt efflux system n=1 Tax=Lasiosphaeria miniovina TaxID=1954250 RepID=A0AA40E025_9PEZI|nr:high-affinity nickel-transport protein-domain-containing protein [Lasiosphaeria miniovina]KAK0717768.1 high-affinity nickel-transport protein-domain-containing protein [Lasiosphaeria miniovina]
MAMPSLARRLWSRVVRRLTLWGPLGAVPAPALRLIGALVAVNAVVWAAAGVVLHYFPKMITPAVLAYTLGLRHALDADHISAIDLMTRRLIASGQRPVAVGTWFSLGHSTVVVVTCVVVAATAGALRDRFDSFQRVGAIIGTSVSAAFLLILCAGNAWVMWQLVKRLREVLLAEQQRARRQQQAEAGGSGGAGEGGAQDAGDDTDAADQLQLDGPGFLANVFRGVFRIVDRPWKMFPLGILFGLGFDTSSEIAILGIASIQAAQGTSLWLILLFPILFTAGMCLLDTTDGALMMALYTSKAFARDRVAILYYSIVLTGITIGVSAFIGVVQVLSLVENVAEPQGSFWDGVAAIGDHYDVIGGSICGVFVLAGLGSVIVYRPWRRRIERKAARQLLDGGEEQAPQPLLTEP